MYTMKENTGKEKNRTFAYSVSTVSGATAKSRFIVCRKGNPVTYRSSFFIVGPVWLAQASMKVYIVIGTFSVKRLPVSLRTGVALFLFSGSAFFFITLGRRFYLRYP